MLAGARWAWPVGPSPRATALMRRKLILAACVLLLAIGGAAAWFAFSLEARIARIVELAASETTGTRVKVGGVKLHLREGTATVRSFTVANPKGFSSAPLLDADDIRVEVDIRSLGQDVLVINEVVITRPRLRFEVLGDRRTNVGVVAEHASSRPAPADEPPQRIRIKRFTIRDASALADATLLGGKEETITLRPITRENLGGKAGRTPEQISAELVDAIRDEVIRAAAREGFNRYLDKEKESVKERIKGLFKR